MNTPLVYQTLISSANQWPDNSAIHDELGTLTFKELLSEAEILKEELINLGIKEGKAIGVLARNGRSFIISIFAVLGTGATVMPISHQLKKYEIDEIVSEAQLFGILDDFSGEKPVEVELKTIQLASGLLRFGTIPQNATIQFAPHVENPAFMRFTSGTTGHSKGVIISHKSAIERVESANKVLKLGPDDTVIWVLPMAYHFVVSILLYVKYGAAIAITRDFLPKNIIDTTVKYKGSLLYASPMQLKLLANDTGTEMISSLKHVISTSAAISPLVCEKFKERFDITVSQAYGIIEIGLPIINYEKSAENPEAVGYALPDYSVEILNDKGEILGPNEIGHLGIVGPGMFDAYLNPPRTREEVLQHGFFMTADYAKKDSDGLITVEGRMKSMINISGNKVFPEEVEGILESFPGISKARISGVPHPIMGQIIQAEVILKPGIEIDTEEALTYCRQRLSTFKVPQRMIFVKELPMTGSGKIIRY